MSSAKLIFFGPPFAPSAAGASPPAPVETAPPAEGATAGSTAGSAIQTGRAVPARRVFSRLESPAGAGAGAFAAAPVGALNAAGRSDANMSFIAGAALFCDCGGGKIAALFCDCGEGARGSGAPRAAERASSLAARLAGASAALSAAPLAAPLIARRAASSRAASPTVCTLATTSRSARLPRPKARRGVQRR